MERKAAQNEMKSLADIRKEEHAELLTKLNDQDIMEMARAHFDSHPALPGEKDLKTMANNGLASDETLSEEQREQLINGYVQTRIRETKIDSKGFQFDPADLKIDPMAKSGAASMGRVKVELQRLPWDTQDHENLAGDEINVYVLAERADGNHMTIGKLPDKFLTNNPMNVESCEAELQVTDHSNGKFKNVSMRVVADTDLMSGDVIDLNEDMLAGLDEDFTIEM